MNTKVISKFSTSCQPPRRKFLHQCVAGATAALAYHPIAHAIRNPSINENEFFLFIHAAGGWDVTLSLDPRNEKKGIIDPATTENQDSKVLRLWADATKQGDVKSFEFVQPKGSSIVFGPAIGGLAELYDRICIINGLAMNTVSHPDGIAFSATGRHLVGGRVPASSIDTMMANEFGRAALLPSVSINFPSYFVGEDIDRRVVPLRVGNVSSIARTLVRADRNVLSEDRDAVTTLLANEAQDLANESNYPDVLKGMAVQYEGLQRMLASNVQETFNANSLRQRYPQFNHRGRFHTNSAINLAFSVEAMKRNMVRCVSFAFGGFDTHSNNYRTHGLVQQEMFDLIAQLVRTLDQTPHPTLQNTKLSEHTHILIMSEFCRTPQINLGGGRDHYPNNSAMVISPKFKGNFVFGKSDYEQLLPAHAGRFLDGERAIAPPDVLATFVHALGANPRKYLRDGEVVQALLHK